MAAGQYPITIEQGATYSDGIRVLYQNGIPFDLTDWTPTMQIRSGLFGILILDMAGSDYFKYQDLANGYFAAFIGATETDDIPAGTYYYDLKLTNNSDADLVIRLLEGKVTVRGEVTT